MTRKAISAQLTSNQILEHEHSSSVGHQKQRTRIQAILSRTILRYQEQALNQGQKLLHLWQQEIQINQPTRQQTQSTQVRNVKIEQWSMEMPNAQKKQFVGIKSVNMEKTTQHVIMTAQNSRMTCQIHVVMER